MMLMLKFLLTYLALFDYIVQSNKSEMIYNHTTDPDEDGLPLGSDFFFLPFFLFFWEVCLATVASSLRISNKLRNAVKQRYFLYLSISKIIK